MVIINTTRFGEIEISEDEIINFPAGIPGFLAEKEFVIMLLEKDNPLAFMQSVKTPDLAFIIADPFNFYHDYEFDLDEKLKNDLAITDIEDVVIKGIVTVPDDFKKATINLKAPIVININKKLAKQFIIESANFPIKAPLFSEKAGEK